MKKKTTRKALCLLLAITVALAFTPMTAFAADPFSGGVEIIKSGESKEFDDGDQSYARYYKFHLDKPSKVVLTAEFTKVEGSPPYDTFAVQIEKDTTIGGYTDKSIKESAAVSSLDIISSGVVTGNGEYAGKGTITYYLNANKPNDFYYICINPPRESGSKGKVTASWTDIRSDGGDTKAKAVNIDAVKGAIVKHVTQSCSEGNWFKFTVPSAADLTVTYSLKALIPTNPSGLAGKLGVEDSKDYIGNTYFLYEKGNAVASNTTKHRLPKAGTYYVNVDYSGGHYISDGSEHTLNIKANLLASKITLNKTKLTLKKGKTFSLKVKKWTPANVGSKTVTWKSSNPKVVKVNKKTGKIKALKKGNAKITAKTSNGKTATCKVTVKK